MNYIILKTIIDSTIQNYNQTNPTQIITDNNVSITNMTAKGIDILIRCPHTLKDIRIHAEVNFMNGPQPGAFTVSDNNIALTTRQIDDNDVTAVHKALQTNTKLSDLFGE